MNTAGNKTELELSNLIELSHILTIVGNNKGIDRDTVNMFIDMHQIMNPDKQLIELKENIRLLYQALSNVLFERKTEFRKSLEVDVLQPKYKISDAAALLKIERATLNNWTNSKGGYIRSFEFEGVAKFILEQDLKKKYQELTDTELFIDEETRNRHQYIVKRMLIKM